RSRRETAPLRPVPDRALRRGAAAVRVGRGVQGADPAAVTANLVAALHGMRDVRIETRDLPALGERDVLVEVRAVGVCGTDVRFFATPPVDGAFARFVAIHEDYAFALPDELSDDAGALLEPLSVAVWACLKGGVGLGDRVLVTGAGPIGNLAAQVARAAGA